MCTANNHINRNFHSSAFKIVFNAYRFTIECAIKEANKECKRVVAIAKENAYSQLYEELKGKEGRKNIYKLANARKRMATDIGRVTAVKDKDGTLLTGDDEVKDRWLGHFDDLLNVENEREDLEGILPVQDQ